MSTSSLFSCCDCCFLTDKAKQCTEFRSQEVVLLPKVASSMNSVIPAKLFEFQQMPAAFTVHPQIPVSSKQPYTHETELSRSFELATKSGSNEGSYELLGNAHQNRDLLPMLEYSLYYDIQRRTLLVFLHQCLHLDPQGASKGAIASYVVLFLLPNKDEVMESKVVENTLDPIFHQVFEFSGIQIEELRQQVLMFRIYRKDKLLSNSLIGSVSVPLDQADLYNELVLAVIDDKMEKRLGSLGEVLISLTFNPQSSCLRGVLLKVANLQRKDALIRTIDPYVAINFLEGNARKEKWKSSTKKDSIMVVYNEPFQFCSSNNFSDTTLEIVVLNYDRFGRDEVIGKVSIGLNVSSDSGRAHWSEALSSPNHAVSRWHMLQS